MKGQSVLEKGTTLTVRALMPLIHDRLTGGSVYNNQVLTHLGKSATVELYLDLPDADRSQWPGGLWLVDSLCLETGASHLRRCPDAAGVLIAHYLHLLDPRYSHSERAERECVALRYYRAVVTTSHFAQRALADRGFPGDIEVISPGLDATYRRPVLHRTPGPLAILTVANVVPDKDPIEMLQAVETLSARNWIWEIIGDMHLDPAFAEKFRGRLSRSPVRERIVIRGGLPPREVQAAYDRCDIFALPSRFETCSMVTMEAMARGLPLVAFRVGALPDLLPEPSRWMLAEPGDTSGLARTLHLFLTDSESRHSYGKANRVASENFPSWERCGQALEDLVSRVLSRKPKGRRVTSRSARRGPASPKRSRLS
jgi:glycosyltransferase involved in cell wall biosynthesis